MPREAEHSSLRHSRAGGNPFEPVNQVRPPDISTADEAPEFESHESMQVLRAFIHGSRSNGFPLSRECRCGCGNDDVGAGDDERNSFEGADEILTEDRSLEI
jgi:hypothetical protein